MTARLTDQTSTHTWIGGVNAMCDETQSAGRRKIAAATPQRVTVEHLRRAAYACRDLNDPLLMAGAWDTLNKPADAVETTT